MSTRRNPMSGILSGPIDAPPEDRLAKVFPKVPAVARHVADPPGQRVQRDPGADRGRRGRDPGADRHGAGLPAGRRGILRRRPRRHPWCGGTSPRTRDAPAVTASGSVAVAEHVGPGGPSRPALGGGRPRRRAGRAGVGRRPAGRGRRGRAPRRHRPPRRGPSGTSARVRPASWACWSTTWSTGHKESAHRRRPSPSPGAHHRHPVRRRLGGGQAVGAGYRGLAPDPHGPGVEGRGLPGARVRRPAAAWRRILSSVRSYADLEPALVGAVERLIDFVTDPT